MKRTNRKHWLRAILMWGWIAWVLTGCGSTSPGPTSPIRPHLSIGGATLRVELGASTAELDQDTLLTWVERSATLVTDYCGGRFPVANLQVDIVTSGRGGLGWGQHWGGERVFARAGSRTTRDQLRRDWVLVHEMLHLAFPRISPSHRWMREGLSTYLETIVRAQAGIVSAEEVWSRWMTRLPLGLAGPQHRGLNQTRTWASVYWGGALFWFRVDLELRRRTNNETSIRDLIQGILAQGGNASVRWPIEQVIAQADRDTQTRVFSELYREMATGPYSVHLTELFEALGVRRADGVIELHDDAPLADVRRSMTAPNGVQLPPLR